MQRVLFSFVLLFFFTSTAFSLNVGVVDLQRALNECEAGKVAVQNLKKTAEVKKKIIERKKAELTKLREELSKKTLKETERGKKEALYETKARELQNFMGKVQGEISNKSNEYQSNILKGLVDMTKKIAKKEKVDIVIEIHGGIVYFSPTMDLTDKLIKAYNKFTQKKR
ncbi:MAG: OmpH family outer membrane protein [Deltaproteobacteria bacterium]|nr:OmpH family outer membrane protein [Deltaproteobacteria bacterium]